MSSRVCVCTSAMLMCGVVAGSAAGYEFDISDRWTRSTIDGTNNVQGDPMNLTWSIVPDGTTTFQNNQPSDLVAMFDNLYGDGGAGSSNDYSTRPWFFIFDQSYSRLSELSGLTFTYLPNDVGTPQSFSSTNGSISQGRGDIRIAGTSIDGQSGSNTLAYNYFPNVGDMVIDTDNTNFYGNKQNNSIRARNVIMHETGHGLGIAHVVSDASTAAHAHNCQGCAACGIREPDPEAATTTPGGQFLMEPFINTSFDGPQLDDILALHRGYGDAYEKSNGGAGNDSAGNAINLGTLVDGVYTRIGTDGNTTAVEATATDFVSIDGSSDLDYFSFTLTERSMVDLVLTPKGPTYNAGPQGGTQTVFDASSLNDLTLTLLDQNGSSLLAFSDDGGLGDSESIINFELSDPGMYFVRIAGLHNEVQLYQLDLFAEAIAPLPGDLNNDGVVNEADLNIVLGSFGRSVTSGSLLSGDPSGDGYVDAQDLRIVLENWSDASSPAVMTPEPGSLAMLIGLLGIGLRRRRQS